MNSTSSTTSRALLNLASRTSGWSALARRSATAASVLLDRMKGTRPVPASVCSLPPVGSPSPCEDAMVAHAIGAPFERWVALTDAYAEQFMRMQRGEKDARDKAMGLSLEIMRMKQALGCVA